MRTTGGPASYPNGPRADLIWSSSEEVLELQGGVARFDDLGQGAGGITKRERGEQF